MALTTVSPGLLDSNAQYYSFKNRIINGAMMIDQRNAGASVSLSAATKTYTLDRWAAQVTTSGTVQQITSTISGFQKSLKYTSTTSNTYFQLGQQIEYNNFYDCDGQTVTVSFWAKANNSNSGSTSLIGRVRYSTSVDTSILFSGAATDTSITISTTATKYSFTYAVPSNAGSLAFEFSLNSHVSGDGYEIAGIQVEKGFTATSFDYRPYQTEFQLCQRYYQQIGSAFYGAVEGTTTFNLQVPYWLQMRTTATVAGISGRYFSCRYAGDTNILNPTLANITSGYENVWLQVVSSGLTNGIPIYGRSQNAGSSDFLSATAEL